MIVKKVPPSWQIIFQPAHALLAAKIAQELDPQIQYHSKFETIIAIAIHDDHPEVFLPNEKNYVTQSGAPRDFSEMDMSEALRFEEASLTIEITYRKSQWMGLLRSFHAHILYAEEDTSADFQKYLRKKNGIARRFCVTLN